MTDFAMGSSGHTFSVRRMQTHDGPGMRTTVFLKGCSLHCAWCHNPEALSPAREVWWLRQSCIGCRTCIEVCPSKALELSADGMHIDRSRCDGSYACVDACPAKAMEALRHDWSLQDLLDEVQRDAAFYASGDGGVTVSGGEPLAQWRFVRDLLRECHAAGIHTALDTCGEGSPDGLDAVLPFTRLVLYDLKLHDPAEHLRWTGANNQLIHKNLRRIADEVRRRDDLSLWIRTPLIPGATAHEENISAIAQWIHAEIEDAVTRWELCAFNPLCAEKYHQLGKTWEFEKHSLLEAHQAHVLHQTALKHCGLSSGQVLLKGRFSHRDCPD